MQLATWTCSAMLILAVHGSAVADSAAELFRHAVENSSTTSEYVLVTAIDDRRNVSRVVCVKAPLLLGALHREHRLGHSPDEVERVRAIALATADRAFRFRRSEALANIDPWYTEAELVSARGLVAELGATGVVHELAHGVEPGRVRVWLNSGATARPLWPEAALAHVLLERGILTGSGCFGGLIVTVAPANPALQPPGEAPAAER